MARKSSHRGFTLIELMITVAIIGILAAIAYPMYLDKVREARRTDAKSALLKAANAEEQYYTVKHQYTNQLADLGINPKTENEAYLLSFDGSETGDQKFKISAKAQGDQTNDKCVTFSINQIGKKQATGGLGGPDVTASCW